MSSFPDARVFSAKRLYLRPPVVERSLDGQDGAYRFEYTGLKLLFHARTSYFLRPSDGSVSVANIIITDSPELRFEFTRSGGA